MPSKIIGKLLMDDQLVKKELETIAQFPLLEEEYPEFGVGTWKNHSLWNKSGDYRDMLVQDYSTPVKITELGEKLPYINEIIHKTFDITHLKMVRARNLVNGLVFPHRDFIELNNDHHYLRVFIPLENNPDAYHSDEEMVFQMQKGEIWRLDAALIHAAANLSTNSRVHICLDFKFIGNCPPIESIFLNPETTDHCAIPTVPFRKKLLDLNEKLNQLASDISNVDLVNTLYELTKLHFQYDVKVGSCYDWLITAAEKSGLKNILDKCKELKKFMIVKRELGESFAFK